MKNVLFIHSAGDQRGSDGSGPLVAALRAGLGADMRLAAPMMPKPDAPDAVAWEAALGDHIRDQQAPVLLVGHSLGGSTIFKYFADQGVPAGVVGVISIAAPFWEHDEWRLPPGFETRLADLPSITLYHSRDDDIVAVSHLDRYADALPRALVRKVDGRGHLFADANVADILADIARAFDMRANVA